MSFVPFLCAALCAIAASSCNTSGERTSLAEESYATSATSSALSEDDEWPMYGRNVRHSFTRASSDINASNAASLALRWTFPTSDAVTASPAVVDGVVYVGAWDGFFYAIDRNTGVLRWKFQVDCQSTIVPIPPQCLAPGQTPPDRQGTDGGLLVSSPAVKEGKVYFTSGKKVYALRASDGQLLFKHTICGKPEAANCEADANDPTNLFSSPLVVDGTIVLGVSADGHDGYRGGIVALDAANGHQRWRFEVDPILDPTGKPVLGPDGRVHGGKNRGCGSVWTTGALDRDRGLVLFGTGDCQGVALPPYHGSLLALDVATGRLAWSYSPIPNDVCDKDFGASANIISTGDDDHGKVGIGGKDGTYHVVKSASGALVWKTNVVFGGNAGGFIGSTAFDGTRVYGATGLGDFGVQCAPSDPRDTQIQDPSIHAFAVNGGAIAWQDGFNYSFGATTVADGVIFNGWIGFPGIPAAMRVRSAATGAVLAELPQAGAVNSSATVMKRAIYFGTGNSYDGAGGGIQAYALP